MTKAAASYPEKIGRWKMYEKMHFTQTGVWKRGRNRSLEKEERETASKLKKMQQKKNRRVEKDSLLMMDTQRHDVKKGRVLVSSHD